GRVASVLNAEAVITTASDTNRPLIIGVGCRSGAKKESIVSAIDDCLAQVGRDREEVRLLASVDIKASEAGLLQAAAEMRVPIRFVSLDSIAAFGGDYTRSQYVTDSIGVAGVCEPAALISGRKARLILPKTKFPGITVAIAEEATGAEGQRVEVAVAANFESDRPDVGHDPGQGDGRQGKIYVVGIGPGDLDQMSPAAEEAIRRSSVIVGYRSYLRLVEPLLDGRKVISSGMRHEVERGKAALGEARRGERVAVISSGDPGVYGMAGVVLELLGNDSSVSVEVIPGISASLAAAAALGAPLMHDFATISLSDLLTPWQDIVRRLDLAAEADFVIALYNPRSVGRPDLLAEALGIIGRHRDQGTPVGIVRQARRGDQQVSISPLGQVDSSSVDMLTTLIVGNSRTKVVGARMVTPRGYALEDCRQ
ncbi:MAG: precorrin-3B C(17)-methyltransferase, partial [Chloroflexi bacterium]|nr:precorrin-3B C(17)-methyltransferase [Chloroflexota bacterium]